MTLCFVTWRIEDHWITHWWTYLNKFSTTWTYIESFNGLSVYQLQARKLMPLSHRNYTVCYLGEECVRLTVCNGVFQAYLTVLITIWCSYFLQVFKCTKMTVWNKHIIGKTHLKGLLKWNSIFSDVFIRRQLYYLLVWQDIAWSTKQQWGSHIYSKCLTVLPPYVKSVKHRWDSSRFANELDSYKLTSQLAHGILLLSVSPLGRGEAIPYILVQIHCLRTVECFRFTRCWKYGLFCELLI